MTDAVPPSSPSSDSRRFWHLLYASLRHLCALPARYVGVLVLAHLGVFLVAGPAIAALVQLAMDRAGLPRITENNITELLNEPAALPISALIVAIVVAVSITSYALTLVIADLQWRGDRPSLRLLARTLGSALRATLRPEVLLLAAQIVVLAPLAGFTLFSPFTSTLAVPPFVQREFLKTTTGTLGWSVVAALLLYISFRTILTFAFVVVTGRRPARGFIASLSATGRDTLRLAAQLGLTAAAGALLWLLAAVGIGGVVDLLSVNASDSSGLIRIATLVLSLVSVAHGLLFALVMVGVAREHGSLASVAAPVRQGRVRGRRRLIMILPVFLSLVTVGATLPPAALAKQVGATPLVIAHRGYDSGGVENTISALDAAAPLHPDIVEVDILQTGDGGFVATHDSNLLVLAGRNENVYDLTTAEVTATTVSMKGHSDTIPTMADYVSRAAELGLPLLIEFKVTGHEQPDFVATALAELDSLGALEGNTFHSLSSTVVREIKKLHPELRVGLTIGLQYGETPSIDCDFYTIEQSSYTTEFLRAAHAAGREVYVWTVNGELTMHELLRAGVDGLVTDRIPEAKQYRDEVRSGSRYTPGDALDVFLQQAGWR